MSASPGERSANAPFFVDKEVIRLTANGVWLSDQTEIDHENTVKLFFRSIQKDDQGYFLKVSYETKRIEVEDTAYFVFGLEGTASEGYVLLLSDGTREPLNPSTLKYQVGRLTCRVHQPEVEAKFLHKAYMEILKPLEQEGEHYVLQIGEHKIILAKVDSSVCG
jgi:hypothetical protein